MNDHTYNSKSKKKQRIVHYLPVYGCIATGILYAAIGVIALLSFLKIRNGGADEASMMAILADYFAGKIAIAIILAGTICYIIWRFYEAITDPYEYGKSAKGLVKRTGIVLSTIADMLIVYTAIRVLLGIGNIQPNGQPAEEQAMVKALLLQYGNWLVISIGIVYAFTALVQLVYGVTRGYKERVNLNRWVPAISNTVHVLAWLGYFGRGVILGIIGYFFIKAGIAENAAYIVNTDKAFDFIGDHIGHLYFIFIAVATICYGLFMFAQGVGYDTDKD